MKSFPKNPFKNLVLDKEEREIEKAIESGKVKEVKIPQNFKKQLQQYARFTLDKNKNVNIRLPQRDLLRLKAKAAEAGIPYQTLAGSILHRFVNSSKEV